MLRNPLKLFFLITFSVRMRDEAVFIQISMSLRWNVDLQIDVQCVSFEVPTLIK